MVSSPLLALLNRYSLAKPFLLGLKPPSEFVGLHVVVANLIAAIKRARVLYLPAPPALANLQRELEWLMAELDATVSRSSLDSSSNVVKGELISHPLYGFWSLSESTPYERERETVAAVALLLARGQSIPPSQLMELRRGLERGSDGRKEYARISRALVERAHAATVLLRDDAWDQEPEDALEVTEILADTNDYCLVGAANEPEARHLAATIHATLRRNFTRAGAYAPVGDCAKMMLADLRQRVSREAPCPAATTLLLSIYFQRPAGAVLRETEWARLDDDCRLESDGIWRIDPDRGLASIPIPGFESFWRPDEDVAAFFLETDGATVVALPVYLASALKRLRGDRSVGPVIEDSAVLRKSVLDLVAQLRVRMGGRLSVQRIAGTLGFAFYQVTRDMAALQRLAGHDLDDSLARGSYYRATHAQVGSALETALTSIGLIDASNPLPALPSAFAERLNGARRISQPPQIRDLAKQLNERVLEASRSKPDRREELLSSVLAVHAAAQLMLGVSHRWSGAIGELTRWKVCPQVGLAIFSDKPVDALHARRLVMLPHVVSQTLQGWLEYCEWLVHHGTEAIAHRAREALQGTAPLLFRVERGTAVPLTLSAIAETVGPVGTAVLRGARCLISSHLRECGIDAARIDAQLGHTWYGQTPFDVANLASPREFLGPVAKATHRMLRDLGFRSWSGAPARSRPTPVDIDLPAPSSSEIARCVAEADALASRERDAFAAAVAVLLPDSQDAATAALKLIAARGEALDRKAVRGVFAQLCAAGDGRAVAAVAAGRAVQAALHQLRRDGVEAEGLSFYEPVFPTPPWLASGHLLAWHVRRSCLTWLHDPAQWSEPSPLKRVARFVLLLIVHGVVSDLDQALCVVRALPAARAIRSVPDALLVPVNWTHERREMPAETVWLTGELALAAMPSLQADGSEATTRDALSAALVRALRTSPWPPANTSIDELLAGWQATASLCAVLTEPGAIAARIRGALTTRELPLDLCRAVLDEVAAAPPPRPAANEQVDAEARKRGHARSDGAFISEVYRRLEATSASARLHTLAMTVTGRHRVLAEVASRLSTVAGEKVDQYALGSQRTFLSRIAAPLLDALKGVDLGNASAVEACLLALWHDEEPDPRRLIGLQLAAEVLEDLFLGEPLDLDGLPFARSVPKIPRALMPAPTTWNCRDEAFAAMLETITDPETRIALCELMDSLVVQGALNLRTGEVGAMRHGDVSLFENTVVARVAPHRNAVLKSRNAIRTIEVDANPELARIAGRFVGLPAHATCFKKQKVSRNLAISRGDLFRELARDWRLRPHDLRSAFASLRLLAAVATRDDRGHWRLRSDPDSKAFREASATLGHANASTTFQSYVHLLRFWQALRLSRCAQVLTLATLASLVDSKPGVVKERLRREAGAGESECRSTRVIADLARAHLLPWPSDDAAKATVEGPAKGVHVDVSRLSHAIHATKDGSSILAVSRGFGVPEGVLASVLETVNEVSAGFGLAYLPVGILTTEADSDAADLRVLAVSKPRVSIDTTPSASTAVLIGRLLGKLDSRCSTFGSLTESEVRFLVETPLSRNVRWDIEAAIPAHLAERQDDALATPADMERWARARGAEFSSTKTPRKRGPREITYTAAVRGVAAAVKGPALVESLLISLALATNPHTANPAPTNPQESS
jgi:hypothetical protein